MTQGKTRDKFVPNAGKEGADILVIGEAPGEDEEDHGYPFYENAPAGEKFTNCFGRNGIQRTEIFCANLSHYRPAFRNKFELVLGTPELEQGITDISEYIRKFRPKVIAALGNYPMHFLTGKGRWKKGRIIGINKWRGSVLSCILPGCEDTKVIPTYHPSMIARDPTYYPIFDMDIKRIVQDAAYPEKRLPERKFVVLDSCGHPEYDYWIDYLLSQSSYSFDIENFGTKLACIGFSADPSIGICFINDFSNSFNLAMERVLISNTAEKIPHFGIHDTEFLRLERGLVVTEVRHDTYIAQTVLNPELPNSLAFLGSIYTRQPYWKDDKKEKDDDTKSWNEKTINKDKLWIYNCIDACTTLEIALKQKEELRDKSDIYLTNKQKTFIFRMEYQYSVANAMSREGLEVDEERRKVIKAGLTYNWVEAQNDLNNLCGFDLNVNSTKQVPALLYDAFKLPVHTKRETGSRTADEDAIISLLAYCKKEYESKVQPAAKQSWLQKFLVLRLIWSIRGLRKTISTYCNFKVSIDGRCRSTFKFGPETGRSASTQFIDNTGLNGQTLPRDPIEFSTEALQFVDSPFAGIEIADEPSEDEDEEDE